MTREVGHFAANGPGFHMDGWGTGPWRITSATGKQSWLFEFSDRFGPLLVDMFGEPREHQPVCPSDQFWKPFEIWLARCRREGFPAPVPVRDRRRGD
jgi:hypothetical protein